MKFCYVDEFCLWVGLENNMALMGDGRWITMNNYFNPINYLVTYFIHIGVG